MSSFSLMHSVCLFFVHLKSQQLIFSSADIPDTRACFGLPQMYSGPTSSGLQSGDLSPITPTLCGLLRNPHRSWRLSVGHSLSFPPHRSRPESRRIEAEEEGGKCPSVPFGELKELPAQEELNIHLDTLIFVFNLYNYSNGFLFLTQMLERALGALSQLLLKLNSAFDALQGKYF